MRALLSEPLFWVGAAAVLAAGLFYLDHLRTREEQRGETYAEEARRNYGRNP